MPRKRIVLLIIILILLVGIILFLKEYQAVPLTSILIKN